MSAKKRQQLSLETKYEIINKLKNKNINRKTLLSDYNINSYSHLTQLWKNRDKIIEKYETIGKKLRKSVSRVRSSNFPDVEEVRNDLNVIYVNLILFGFS